MCWQKPWKKQASSLWAASARSPWLVCRATSARRSVPEAHHRLFQARLQVQLLLPVLPKRFPSPVVTPMGSGLLSKVLRSSNLGLAFTQAPPITTSANTANLTATSTSSSRGLIRNSSGDNLLSYFQRPSSSLNPDKRRSVDSSELVHTGRLEDFRGLPLDTNASSMPSLVRRASSGDLSSMDKPSFSAAAEIPGAATV